MAKWLTQEWLDEGKKLAEGQPERPGASARLQYVITGGPDGDIRYYWVLENGKLLESRLGELADAEVTLTQSYEDAMRIQKNELDANAAFMQGRVKVTGNMAKLMATAADHELGGVQAAPDRHLGDHRVLIRSAAPARLGRSGGPARSPARTRPVTRPDQAVRMSSRRAR